METVSDDLSSVWSKTADWLDVALEWHSSAHPYIDRPLTLGAPLFAGSMAFICAARGEKKDNLTFLALALAFYVIAMDNMLSASSENPASHELRLHLSAASSALEVVFGLAMVLNWKPDTLENVDWRKMWNTLRQYGPTSIVAGIPLSVAAVTVVAVAEANDGASCTISTALASVGLLLWARQFSAFYALIMLVPAAGWTATQFNYWGATPLELDVLRVSEIAVGLLLARGLLGGGRGSTEGQGGGSSARIAAAAVVPS